MKDVEGEAMTEAKAGGIVPRASRPHIPGYGIPRTRKGMLDWEWARERLEVALVYWVASIRPEGGPHVMPTWGVWLDERFWFEGGMGTRRARNIAHNPAIVVHVEQGDDAVIVEGMAEMTRSPDADLAARLVEGYGKYRTSHGYTADPANWESGGLWAMRPTLAFAWSKYPQDATRWHFEPA
jgi:nitroimidazol reductase NimA-like FMN-containing flavoprotein (pyridoxamine 5'-phosphate oxidase superfamily)